MKFTKILCIAAFIGCFSFAKASGIVSGSSSDYSLSTVECTQVNPDHIHLTCKMSDQTELNASLINYDVKNSEGNVIGSGYGSTVFVDNSKLASEEEYSIVVTAIVNGNAVSQTVTRKAPTK